MLGLIVLKKILEYVTLDVWTHFSKQTSLENQSKFYIKPYLQNERKSPVETKSLYSKVILISSTIQGRITFILKTYSLKSYLCESFLVVKLVGLQRP